MKKLLILATCFFCSQSALAESKSDLAEAAILGQAHAVRDLLAAGAK